MAPTSPSKVKESVAADEAVAAEAAAKSEAQKAEVEADLEEALGGMVFRWVFRWVFPRFSVVFLWFFEGRGRGDGMMGMEGIDGLRMDGWMDGDEDVFFFFIVVNDEISDGYCF